MKSKNQGALPGIRTVFFLALIIFLGYFPLSVFAAEPKGWEELQAKAKQEGRLVILAGGAVPRTLMPVIRHFGEKFGIKPTVARGSGRELADRVLAERGTGRYTADVAMTGSTTIIQRLMPPGVVDPMREHLIHPEVLDTKYWFQNKHWYADGEGRYALIFSAEPREAIKVFYNTKMVTPKDLERIKSMWDWLDPKWKGGKIVAQPPGPGAGGTYFSAYVHPGLGPKWVRRFMELEPFYTGEARLITDGLARGRFAVGMLVGAVWRDIEELEKQGLPVASFDRPVKEAHVLAAGGNTQMAVMNRPANPNATKLFVNWWYSREGQVAMHELGEAGTYQTLREDVPPGKIPSSLIRRPGADYLFLEADPQMRAKFDEAAKFSEELYRELRGKK